MTTRKKTAPGSAEALGQKLLQSVREMKARDFARVTEVEVNEVVQVRQSTGLSQSEFASALSPWPPPAHAAATPAAGSRGVRGKRG